MMLQTSSSTAWTRALVGSSLAPAAAATDRTSARTSACRFESAGMVRVAGSRSKASPIIVAGATRPSADPGVIGGAPLHEPPGALPARELAVADDHGPAAEHDVGSPSNLATLVAGVVDVHVVGLRADRPRGVRVVDHDVGIRADGDGALRRIHPEELRGRRRDDLDPALLRDSPGDDATVVEQVDAVLDARKAVRDLPEIAPAELLLALEIERAMVGRDELEVVLDQPLPQLGLVVRGPERRRAHELGALEAVAHVVEREEEVLRTRLG